jgi:hypothetical protein
MMLSSSSEFAASENPPGGAPSEGGRANDDGVHRCCRARSGSRTSKPTWLARYRYFADRDQQIPPVRRVNDKDKEDR